MTMYADDTSIPFTTTSINNLNMMLNKELNSLQKWLKGHGMNIFILYDLRSLVQLDSLNMPSSYCHRTLFVKCIMVSLNCYCFSVWGHGGGQGSRGCKNFKTMQLEL